eukprot:364469-Chlamydomonas_euryale.AAC.10
MHGPLPAAMRTHPVPPQRQSTYLATDKRSLCRACPYGGPPTGWLLAQRCILTWHRCLLAPPALCSAHTSGRHAGCGFRRATVLSAHGIHAAAACSSSSGCGASGCGTTRQCGGQGARARSAEARSAGRDAAAAAARGGQRRRRRREARQPQQRATLRVVPDLSMPVPGERRCSRVRPSSRKWAPIKWMKLARADGSTVCELNLSSARMCYLWLSNLVGSGRASEPPPPTPSTFDPSHSKSGGPGLETLRWMHVSDVPSAKPLDALCPNHRAARATGQSVSRVARWPVRRIFRTVHAICWGCDDRRAGCGSISSSSSAPALAVLVGIQAHRKEQRCVSGGLDGQIKFTH